MLESIKLKIKEFFRIVSEAINVQSQEDYEKANEWLRKAKLVCGVCTVLGVVYGLVIGIAGFSVAPALGVLLIPVGLFLGEWSFWGLATFILNIHEILNIKKMAELGKIGYSVGKEIKETHVNVTHEFGNQYKVTAHTEDKGCLVAFILIFIRFLGWMYFSVFVGAFLTVKKLTQTIRNVKEYQKSHC